MAELIPLFPLGHVLLPGMPLPLHIFEQRYRELLADVAAPGGARFGVVALRSGTEALTPARAAGAHPTSRRSARSPRSWTCSRPTDGTSDLLCVGSRRFRIESLLPPAASRTCGPRCEFLDEADGDLSAGQADAARELMRASTTRCSTRLAGPDHRRRAARRRRASCPTGSRGRLPLPPDERQALLAEATTAGRLTGWSGYCGGRLRCCGAPGPSPYPPPCVRLVTGTN